MKAKMTTSPKPRCLFGSGPLSQWFHANYNADYLSTQKHGCGENQWLSVVVTVKHLPSSLFNRPSPAYAELTSIQYQTVLAKFFITELYQPGDSIQQIRGLYD